MLLDSSYLKIIYIFISYYDDKCTLKIRLIIVSTGSNNLLKKKAQICNLCFWETSISFVDVLSSSFISSTAFLGNQYLFLLLLLLFSLSLPTFICNKLSRACVFAPLGSWDTILFNLISLLVRGPQLFSTSVLQFPVASCMAP